MESKFWNVFAPGPILDVLGSHLRIGDIISLSRTCRGLSGIYQELLSRQWDVDVLLKRFFDRPKQFRAQLGLADALVTGSFALEFFERGDWRAQNLDIVVVQGAGAEDLFHYFTRCEQYTFCDREDEPGAYFFKHVVDVLTFSRKDRGTAQRIKLYILSAASFPVRSVLEGFWATLLINFLTWNMAYSVFPSQTFLHHNSYLLQRPDSNHQLPLQKYTDRGWRFNLAIPVAPDDSASRPSLRRTRKIADRMSWKIPLSTADVHVPGALDAIRPDDHVAISEIIMGIDQETLDHVEAMGSCKLSGNFVNHYDVKYMRYCGFLF